MSLSDKERAALAAELARLTPEGLNLLHGKFQEVKRSLEDANTVFPETRDFLNARGLTHVSQLDRQGLEDLRRHLESALAKLVK